MAYRRPSATPMEDEYYASSSSKGLDVEMASSSATDTKKGIHTTTTSAMDPDDLDPTADFAAGSMDLVTPRAHILQSRFGPLRKMREGEEWLDKKLGIETQGIDRIPEEQKKPPSVLNIFFMWWSLNLHVGVVPLGVLGPE